MVEPMVSVCINLLRIYPQSQKLCIEKNHTHFTVYSNTILTVSEPEDHTEATLGLIQNRTNQNTGFYGSHITY